MKAERQRVLIAFADMTGFGPWARRSAPTEFMALMSQVYDEFFHFQIQAGCLIKLLADGYLAVCPLAAKREEERVVRFLRALYVSGNRVNRIIRKQVFPRPKGFRVRVVLGEAWLVTLKSGLVDYLGYQVNYCQRLLDVGRDGENFLASESVYDSLTGKKAKDLTFRKIRIDGVALSGVDPEDLRLVYAFKFKR
jgi:class 3 adenylate cyclase